jgi:hypothetical protein
MPTRKRPPAGYLSIRLLVNGSDVMGGFTYDHVFTFIAGVFYGVHNRLIDYAIMQDVREGKSVKIGSNFYQVTSD